MDRPDEWTPTADTSAQLELPADSGAPARARRATREALTAWRLSGLIDAVVLAVSELITNAVRHGRPPVALHLRRAGHQVLVQVHDGDPEEPPGATGSAEPDAESGRGLQIVRTLADQVDVEHVPADGKIVHLAFQVPDDDEEPS